MNGYNYENIWKLLKQLGLIRDMLRKVDYSQDDLTDLIEHWQEALQQLKLTQAETFLIELHKRQLTVEDLRLAEKSQKPNHAVMAVVDGKFVNLRGVLPNWLKEYGWKSRDDIPEKYWTNEYKESRCSIKEK